MSHEIATKGTGQARPKGSVPATVATLRPGRRLHAVHTDLGLDIATRMADLLDTLAATATFDDFRGAMLQALAVVPGDGALFAEIDFDRGLIDGVALPDELVSGANAKLLRFIAREHPVLRHQRTTREMGPLAISDVMSERAFRASPLYVGLFQAFNIEDQLVIRIPHEELWAGLMINRETRGFSEQDIAIAGLLQRGLHRALREYRARDIVGVTREVRRTEFEEHGRTLLYGDRWGSLYALDGTRADIDTAPGFAQAISDTIRAVAARTKSPLGDGPLASITFPSEDGGEYTARILPRREGSALWPVVLTQPRDVLNVDDLRARGLSPREAEVMVLILAGESSSGVGVELGISPRTVDKHLERAFRHLGVGNRTEALSVLLRHH